MLNDLKIMFFKGHKDAITPTYEKSGDAACSLRVVESCTIQPNERVLLDTGIIVAIPDGYEGQIRPRSGLAWKKGLTVINTPGTVDSGFRSTVKVALINLGDAPIEIKKGDAVAQMKISPFYRGHFIEVEDISALGMTDRGLGGFGSTGN